jgi:hypothetical protein
MIGSSKEGLMTGLLERMLDEVLVGATEARARGARPHASSPRTSTEVPSEISAIATSTRITRAQGPPFGDAHLAPRAASACS